MLLTWKISMKGERESGAALNCSHFDCDVCFPLPRDDARQLTTHVSWWFRSRWCLNSKCQEQSTVRAPCGKRCCWAVEEHSPLIHPLPCPAYRQIKCQVSACLVLGELGQQLSRHFVQIMWQCEWFISKNWIYYSLKYFNEIAKTISIIPRGQLSTYVFHYTALPTVHRIDICWNGDSTVRASLVTHLHLKINMLKQHNKLTPHDKTH